MGLAPKVQFVHRGGADLAYQVFGDGPANLLYLPIGVPSRTDLAVSDRARVTRTIGDDGADGDVRHARLGMSDRLPAGGYPIEELAADALAVMDAAGFDRAVLWGDGMNGAVAIWLAVHCPERVDGLILNDASACMRAHPGYDIGFTDNGVRRAAGVFQTLLGNGRHDQFPRTEPRRRRATGRRVGALRAHDCDAERDYRRVRRRGSRLDVRDLLPASIDVPTLVIHSATSDSHSRLARPLSRRAHSGRALHRSGFRPRARIHDGRDPRRLSPSSSPAAEPPRTSNVRCRSCFSPTSPARPIGPPRSETRRGVTCSPSSAASCATCSTATTHGRSTRAATTSSRSSRVLPSPSKSRGRSERRRRRLGLEVRSGLHLGEVEQQGDDFAGLAVHIGARVASTRRARRDPRQPDRARCTARIRHRVDEPRRAPPQRGAGRMADLRSRELNNAHICRSVSREPDSRSLQVQQPRNSHLRVTA